MDAVESGTLVNFCDVTVDTSSGNPALAPRNRNRQWLLHVGPMAPSLASRPRNGYIPFLGALPPGLFGGPWNSDWQVGPLS